MSRFLSTPRPPADIHLHPIHIADSRMAVLRRQARTVLLTVAASMFAANVVGFLVTLMLAVRP
ncbi:hypothetical protein V5G24_00050 [Xanthobacter sp. VTT E-85241]|uniref:hypothetical protein n=1 Tax=Roseixanthobacter finlandensis TaxID=3119922 RepID=UPI00372621E3